MMIACQEYIKKNTFQWINDLSPSENIVLKSIVQLTNNIKTEAYFCQKDLARQFDYEQKQIYRATRKFFDVGIIKKDHWIEDGKIIGTYIKATNFFMIPHVRDALYAFFGIAQEFLTKFGMLHRENVPSYKNLKSKSNIQVSTPSKIGYLYNPSGPDSSLLEYTTQKKVGVGKEMNENLARKVLKIESALIERGEKLCNIDTAKLVAFGEECLDYASLQMKHSKPKLPFNFFLKLCFDFSRNNNREPRFDLADHVRSNKLLDPYRPSVQASLTQSKIAQQVRPDMGQKSTTYEDGIRERANIQKLSDDKYKSNLEGAIERQRAKYKPLTAVEKNKVDRSNPFMEMIIKAQIKALDQYPWDSEDAQRIRNNLAEWGIPL